MVYTARVQPNKVIRETVDDFLNRLFDGQALPLLHHLIHDRSINDQEIRQLREMIDQWKAKQDDSEHS